MCRLILETFTNGGKVLGTTRLMRRVSQGAEVLGRWWRPSSIGAIAALRVGDAAQGVLRDGTGVGQEAEAEKGDERQCEGAFHNLFPRVLMGSPPCAGAHG